MKNPGKFTELLQKTIPFQSSPDIVFEQLFGTVASKDRYKLASKRSLLDFMASDVKKIQRAMPSEEKAKLDYCLDALEGLQDSPISTLLPRRNFVRTRTST